MHDMLENEIKPAREKIKQEEEELQHFIEDVKAAMLKAYQDYQKKVEAIAKRNGAEIEVQYHRLKDFEERNVESADNS